VYINIVILFGRGLNKNWKETNRDMGR